MIDDKFIDNVDIDDYEVLTPDGWKDFDGIYKTKPFQIYEIQFTNTNSIKCADMHIFMSGNNKIFAKDLCIGSSIDGKNGELFISNIIIHDEFENMYDLSNVDDSLYYTNGIVSHNTTTISAYVLWYAIFNDDKTIGIVSNKQVSAIDIMNRIKRVYQELPTWMKPGITEWSKTFITFENGTRIMVSATSEDAFRGRTLNLLCLGGENTVTVRDKTTGEIKEISLDELHNELKKIMDYVENTKYEILTPYGWCNFKGINKKGQDKLFTIKSGEDVVTATTNHTFYVEGEKKKVCDLIPDVDKIDGCSTPVSGITYDRTDDVFDVINVDNEKNMFLVNRCHHTKNCMDEYAFVPKFVADAFWAANYPTISASTDAKIIIVSCVIGKTYIYTKRGIRQLNDFINTEKEVPYFVDNYSILGKTKMNNGSLIVNSGKVDTKIITTTTSSIEGSLNHKLFACKDGKYGWYKISELDKGDFVSIQYGMNIWGNDDKIDFISEDYETTYNNKKYVRKFQKNKCMSVDTITPDLAYLFGLYIAEGNAYEHGVTITCGDDISNILDKLNLNYYLNKDGLHYNISNTSLSNLLQHIGFNIKLHAKNKEIPLKLMSMSKENTCAMISGIFDGDGYSRSDRGTIGISLSSKKLIEQIKMILLNIGCLSNYFEGVTQPTKRVRVSSNYYKLELDRTSSMTFYDEIGFRFTRKQNNKCKLGICEQEKVDIIPFANTYITPYTKEIKKYMPSINRKRDVNHLSRRLMLRIKDILQKIPKEEKFNYILENCVSKNIKWERIKSIGISQNEVYDFSLDNIDNDDWCHSVIYNGYIGHQTPHGMFNSFHTLYSNAERNENNFKHFKSTWKDVPGRDAVWAENQRKNLGNKKFAQEYAVEFLGSTNTVISPDVMEYLFSMYNEPILTEMNDKFRIYEKPLKDAKYVVGCLPPNENVLTVNGLKNIIDITPSDILYDNNGNETKIKNIQVYKDFEGDVYDIETYGSVRKTKFTGEHPLYASHQPIKMKRMKNHPTHGMNRYRDFNFQYIKTEDVNINDWICFPNMYNKIISNNELDKKWDKYNTITRTDFQIKDNPLTDKDFWWFIGIWLGDGWIQSRNDSYGIYTCHDAKKEYHFAEKIKNIIEKYDRCVSIRKRDDSSTISTRFNSKQIHHFLQDTFGQYSHEKYISEWVKYIPTEYKLELIRGYIDSDGCVLYRNKQCSVSIVSTSLYLMEDIQDILYSLGHISSIGLLRKKGIGNVCGRTCNIKETYQLKLHNYDSVNLLNELNYKDFDITKIKIIRNRNKRYCYFNDDKTQIYIRIKNITKSRYNGDVYNFETESHTFLCRNLVTHNCDTAKGTGENDSVIQVLKFVSMKPIIFEQVAVYQDDFTDVYSFADIINRVSIYYNGAFIMVENNAEGAAVVNKLWWDIETENLINTGNKAANLGIRATKNTKPKAVLLMKKLIEDECLIINDKETVEQLSSFIEQNGKFFGKDLKDDLVSALYWAVYVTQMDIFDETLELKSSFTSDNEEEIWGVMADLEDPNIDNSFKWLDDILIS